MQKIKKKICCLTLSNCRPIGYLKGHSQLLDRADLDTTSAGLKRVCLNPKSNVRVGYIKKSASILPSVSFDPRSFTENLFLSKFNLSYDIILSYLDKTSIQRNMNRRGKERVGAGREKLRSFTKITKEMNQ